MRREFFFTLDPQVLAVRYAFITALRVGWLFLLAGTNAVWWKGLYPNLLDFAPRLSYILDQLVGGVSAAVPALVSLAFALIQAGLLVGAVLLVLDRTSPALLDKLPFLSRPREGGVVDGKRLRRAWWGMPLLLTISVTVTLYVISGALMSPPRNFSIAAGMARVGPVPFYIGLVIGLLGLLAGWRFNTNAAAVVGADFNVKELSADHPLTQRVHALAAKLDLPPPKVGLTDVVNAFAVGSSIKNAMVVIGVPLARHMTPEELDAIIGHELGHIVSGDMRQMQFAEGYQRMFGGMFHMMGQMGGAAGAQMARSRSTAGLSHTAGDLFSFVGRMIVNLAGELMVKGLSRSREYYADAIGASVTSAGVMAAALGKLNKIPHKPTDAESEYGYLMFSGNAFRWIFSTHPTLERRMAALDRRTHLRLMPMRKAT